MVVADSHLFRCKDGTIWCDTAMNGYDFWKRYLLAFDEVKVVSRVLSVDNIDETRYLRADGKGVQVVDLPYLRGMKEYIVNYSDLRKEIIKAIKNENCAIFRLPSVVSSMALDFFKKTRKAYSIEVVADPMDAYRSNFIAQKYYTRKLKNACLEANGVAYVTERYLQQRYPSYATLNKEDDYHFSTYYSSIDLDESYFGKPRKYDIYNGKHLITHVAAQMNNDNKGHTTLLEVIKQLTARHIPVELICIGDGDRRGYYERMAEEFGISKLVHFVGFLASKEQIRQTLLKSDLFLFPTKAEGLPRVVIEAMAVGLPCLSTPVNGIPELLENKYLFDPLDVDGFVQKIIDLFQNPKEMEEMSLQNIMKARNYAIDHLSARRGEFYTKLKMLTQQYEEGIYDGDSL